MKREVVMVEQQIVQIISVRFTDFAKIYSPLFFDFLEQNFGDVKINDRFHDDFHTRSFSGLPFRCFSIARIKMKISPFIFEYDH